MSVFHNNILGGAAGQTGGAADAAAGPIKSVRFNNGDSPYLNRTPSSASNRRTFTWAAWVKRGVIDASASRTLFSAGSGGFDVDLIVFYGHKLQVLSAISSINWNYVTTASFRDPSAWYHITVAVDTTNSTASDRVKIYVNGTRITEFDTSSAPSQNYENNINSTDQHAVSYDTGNIGYYFDGYMADIYFIDGSALDPTSFGAFDDNGVWQAAAYSGTFGTNGFHLLDFANESTVGHDSSGNNNDFTANNISTTAGAGNDVLFDVPTNGTQTDTGAGGEVSGNYAVLQSNFGSVAGAVLSPSNGNLTVTSPSSDSNFCPVSIPVSSGKWYVEVTAAGSGTASTCGVWQSPIDHTTNYYQNPNYRYWQNDGNIYDGNGGNSAIYNVTWAAGDVVGIALDMDNGKVFFSKNGTFLGTSNPVTGANPAASGLTGSWVFALQSGSGTNHTLHINTGQRSFANTAPSGYKALCTTNLPDPTIEDGSAYFDTLLWTGNGATSRTFTGLNFAPDFIWHSARSIAWGGGLVDAVRGVGSGGPTLRPFNNAAEETVNNFSVVSALTSDGFTVTKGSHGSAHSAYLNQSSATYVAWAWDAGSSTASNTDGTITSSVRANPSAGFSIVSYSGSGSNATVGHGLNAALDFIIIKRRNTTGEWRSWHSALSSTQGIDLNSNGAAFTDDSFNNTIPTSSVFTVKGGVANVNATSSSYIAYCFTSVAGFSAFGSYEGNGSADGPFVYCGFKPRWIMLKNADTGGTYYDWRIIDTARHTYNEGGNEDIPPTLFANASDQERDWDNVDILSNGFKIKDSSVSLNENNKTQIFIAFAENPFQANGGLAR